MNKYEIIKDIRSFVGKGETELALKNLSQLLEGSEKEEFAVMLSARYNNVNQEILLGKIKFEDKTIHLNILNHDILKVLEIICNNRDAKPKPEQNESRIAPTIFHDLEMFLHTKRYSEAIALSSSLIENNVFLIESLINRGAAKFKINDYFGALDDFTKALSIDPENIPALKNRGICFFSLDRILEAKHDWLKIQKLGSFEADYFLPLINDLNLIK